MAWGAAGLAGLGAMYPGYQSADDTAQNILLKKQTVAQGDLEQQGDIAWGKTIAALQQSPMPGATPMGGAPAPSMGGGGAGGPPSAAGSPPAPPMMPPGAPQGGGGNAFAPGETIMPPSGPANPGASQGAPTFAQRWAGMPGAPQAAPQRPPVPQPQQPSMQQPPAPQPGQPQGVQGSGGITWQQIAQKVAQANPGVSPAVLAHAVDKAMKTLGPMINQQSMMQWREQMLNMREYLANQAETARDRRAGIGPGGPNIEDDDITYLADRYRLVGERALTSLGNRADSGQIKRMVIDRARELDAQEGKTAGDTIGRQADIKANTATLSKLTQQRAAIDQFENTAIKNGDVLVQLAEKVDRTGIPVIERWLRGGRKSIQGDPDVSKFNAQITLYRNEVAKIVSNPNLTGVLTQHAQEEAEKFLGRADSAEQIRAVVELLKGDMGRRSKSLDAEIDQVKSGISGKKTTGKTEDDASATGGTTSGGIKWSIQ